MRAVGGEGKENYQPGVGRQEEQDMTQTELIRTMAAELGMTQDAAKNALCWIGHAVEATMRAGESIKLPELGTFTPIPTKERQGRNPRTGEPLTIPAGTRIKFKPTFEIEG